MSNITPTTLTNSKKINCYYGWTEYLCSLEKLRSQNLLISVDFLVRFILYECVNSCTNISRHYGKGTLLNLISQWRI